jgi:hypothetical protein
MPKLGLGLSLPQTRVVGTSFDPDALAYLTAVEAADGQALENPVKIAINTFVVGCKTDGIWSAIKASCILAGARTLSGALVPLAGVAPTPFNFSNGDYSRTLGLLGDGSSKYLNSNRNNQADPQNSKHLSAYFTSSNSREFTRVVIGTQTSVGGSFITTNTTSVSFRTNYGGAPAGLSNSGSITGFVSVSRSDGLSHYYRALGNSTGVITGAVSTTPLNAIINVFSNSNLTSYSNGRISFYSIGEAIDQTLFDSRVTTLMADISSALPAGIPTATTNTIYLQSGDPYNEGGYPKQSNGYFGDVGDSKLVWGGTRWEMRGDSYSLAYYNNKPNQTIAYFPDQGDWFDWNNSPAPLIFVAGA